MEEVNKTPRGILMEGMGVKCDEPECNWSAIIKKEGKEALEEASRLYLNQPCPQCGQGVILNVDEFLQMSLMLAAFETFKNLLQRNDPAFIEIMEANAERLREMGIDPDEWVHAEVDMAPCRNGDPPDFKITPIVKH